MGTHSVMAVRDKEGKISRYERTMDGYLIHGQFLDWANKMGTDEEYLHPDPNLIGNGSLQVNQEGEGNGSYILCIDHYNKSYLLYGDPADENHLTAMVRLRGLGWSIGGHLEEVIDDPSLSPKEGSQHIQSVQAQQFNQEET